MNEQSALPDLVTMQVPPALQPQLRLYRRLYLARIDLEEARATVVDLLSRKIALPRRKLPSPLLLAMTTALVVAYARPFVHSRGHSVVADKSVPGALLRGLTSKERELHEYLVNLRNKEVAHSDADALEMSLKLYADGDGAIFRNTRSPFPRSALTVILRVIEKLDKALDQKCQDLRQELPLEVWI